MAEQQIVSKQRVDDHGEVYTGAREVNAMLDLVKQETDRIESRFLEPACGHGNFLVEILSRKLTVVEERYGKSRIEFERYAVLALSSMYGIDLLEDNIVDCRQRLLRLFEDRYVAIFGEAARNECLVAAIYILMKNIVQGDALTMMSNETPPKPIVFPEWSPVNGSMLKRRDFTFNNLLAHAEQEALPLFSDLGESVCLPKPVREYPLIHYLKVADADATD